ncbi:glycerophosphodiester phosphodiesterase [Aliidiomarina indica]|uniref:glycerophosphodiester phosphodiesterase n=1 Tax=Aliidiomarina indica TaxID=2749147 RepID=UPI00189038C9|nr:glycerophosphodiester phosphodiesterase family protein [Aliidiomarina indica]
MPEWISHRGFCLGIDGQQQLRTENTREAFAAALEWGIEHLETDLRITKDGHIALCHDPDLSRVSGDSLRIESLTRTELSRIRLAFGERLMFFDELLDDFHQYKWILDIKPERAEQTLSALNELRQDPAVDRFLRTQARYLLWDASHQQQLTSALPDASCLARQGACYRAGVAALLGVPTVGAIEQGQFYAVPPKVAGVKVLTPSIVRRFHQHDARVIGYLPETHEQHQQALRAGVDQLLTNYAHLIASEASLV